jgi:hypothetical protein
MIIIILLSLVSQKVNIFIFALDIPRVFTSVYSVKRQARGAPVYTMPQTAHRDARTQ